eukprot:270109-Prymnesium_polylepis.1
MRPKGGRQRQMKNAPCRFAGISPSDADIMKIGSTHARTEPGLPVVDESAARPNLELESAGREVARTQGQTTPCSMLRLVPTTAWVFCVLTGLILTAWGQVAATTLGKMDAMILGASSAAFALFLFALLTSKHAIDACTTPAPRPAIAADASSDAHGGCAAMRTAEKAPKPHCSSSYRADVDGLRAVAVVSVIIFHFDEAWLPG